MGNRLIIKDANFTNVAIENVSDNWVSLANKLFQSFISKDENLNYTLFNSHYNSNNELIPRFVMLMESLDAFYNSRSKDIRVFVPDTIRLKPWVLKNLPAPDSNGMIFSSDSSDIIIYGPESYVTGTNNWVSLRNFCYEQLGVSEAVYPYYGATFARSAPNNSSDMSVQNLIDLGFRIEEYVNS